MTRDEIRRTVLETLCQIAPEVDPEQIEPNVDFRDQLDLDSMDYLNFIIAVHKALQVEIPESDYPKMSSLDHSVDYLEQALSKRSA